MLIATFGPSTDRAGESITHEGEQFLTDEDGPISPADIMKYDALGQLTWTMEGGRAWVASLIAGRRSTRDVAMESDAAKKLGIAREQFDEGQYKKALDSLQYVVPGAWTDPVLAGGLLELASQVRAANDERFGDDCDDLIARAQAALADHASTNSVTGICVGRARYLGGHDGLGPPREGWLWVTDTHVGLQEVWVSGSPGNAALPMSSITKIGLDGGQVAVSKVLPVIAFGILGLAARGSKDRTFLMAHTNEECAVFEVDSKSPPEVRVAIAPVLRSAGVPFDDEHIVPHEQPAVAGYGDLVGRLAQLADLHDQGKLTDEEFAAFKAKLMD